NLEVEWHNPIYHQPHSSFNHLYDIVESEIDTAFTVWGNQYGYNDTTWGIQPWLARVSIEGDSLWSRDFTFLGLTTHFIHRIHDVRCTPDGGYIMCGESDDFSPDGSGDGQKGWLIKLDEYGCLVPGCHLDTSTDNLNEAPPFVIKTYPNPTSDYLNIFFKNQEGRKDGIFRLVDMNGRVVLEFKADKMETTYMIDVERYMSGVYFLQYLQPNDRKGEKSVLSSTHQIIISH
ncbi:MAG: T9SS type A sorting domain-containing protein, partial [Bacteroidota bacterium]